MHELPSPVLAAIDLGHSQIERYGLIFAAHIRLGPLKAHPVGDVASSSRVENLERIFTAPGEQGCVSFISRPDIARACGHITSWAEKRRRKLLRDEASQRFRVAAYVLGSRCLALTYELIEVLCIRGHEYRVPEGFAYQTGRSGERKAALVGRSGALLSL